ncbi:hypothetical protein DL98DRAFT_528293 [Cadophora sp. DSE1049]|nr:hypothetical protein DL98DRAFT_528293 [Cadophora sp. DSE1049]
MSSVMSSADAQALIEGNIEEPRFTLFPKLPPELRLMIPTCMQWVEVLPGPRIITVDSWDLIDLKKLFPIASQGVHLNSVSLIILQVSQESRAASKFRYHLTFHHQLSRPIYIDFTRDSLYFPLFLAIETFSLRMPENKQANIDNEALRYVVFGASWCMDLYPVSGLADLFVSKVCADGKENEEANAIGTPQSRVRKFQKQWANARDRNGEPRAAELDFIWMDLADVKVMAKRGITVANKK